MSSKHRCLMIGAGGFAGAWIRRFLPSFTDRMEVVGLVDVSEAALTASGDFLGLAPHQRFQDMTRAFETVEADFCVIVIPPAFHKEAVLHALARKLPILSEKPIGTDRTPRGLPVRRMRTPGIATSSPSGRVNMSTR